MKLPAGSIVVSLLAILALLAVACGGDDDDDAADVLGNTPTPGPDSTASEGDDDEDAGEGDDNDDGDDVDDLIDFGDGAAVVVVGDERYEFALGGNIEIDGTRYIGVCQSLFGLITGSGYDPEGGELALDFEIPPQDWESWDDGRYEFSPPRIEIEGVRHAEQDADDPNAGGWRADVQWQEGEGTVAAGASQLDEWEVEDGRATGTATFLAVNYFGAPLDGVQPVEGTFDIGCAED